jgi:1,4-dihydroxy-2-naphthoate octaprenyltransferase
LLPAFYTEGIHIARWQVWILFFDQLVFILALCMLFNVRDYEEDKAAGIITPVVALSPQIILTKGKWLICLLNVITGILLIQTFHFNSPIQYAAVLIPAILLYLLFQFFRPERSEMQFVYLHDGLMPVKALLLIFAVI